VKTAARYLEAALFGALASLVACSKPAPPPSAEKPAPEPLKITQFYASAPELARGDKELLCYGVEHAKTVWLSPPRQQLDVSPNRCIEVNPERTTTYTLTAEGDTGAPATQTVTVTVGPAKPKPKTASARLIRDVTVTALSVKSGQPVGICYEVGDVRSVTISPINFHGSGPKGCTTDQPSRTTTYVISAVGGQGERDEEKVTVKVQ
jgi:hypothetical protein